MAISRTLDANARYQESHEWVRLEGDIYACGVSDFAQSNLMDVVYVELPEVGATLARGENFGAIESVKSANDLYMPLSGEIVEVNAELEDLPEKVNEEPYGEGWMIKIRPSNPDEWNELLDGPAYDTFVETEL